MKTRILTMFAILACVIPALLFGGILIDALVVFIIVVGLHEVCQLSEQHCPRAVEYFLIAAVLFSLILDTRLRLPYVGFVCIILLAMPVFSEKCWCLILFYVWRSRLFSLPSALAFWRCIIRNRFLSGLLFWQPMSVIPSHTCAAAFLASISFVSEFLLRKQLREVSAAGFSRQ